MSPGRWWTDCFSPHADLPPRKLEDAFRDSNDKEPLSHTRHYYYQEDYEQALRDYKVTIEYKHLKQHAPGGVYLVPALESLRHFYGVIFIRRGIYTNGIFKFQLTLPKLYNDVDQHPQLVFTSNVYNPHVDPLSGKLDVETAYPEWDPTRHYLVTILTFVKKIFYAKDYADAQANPKAKVLHQSNPDEFRQRVDECVRESQKQVYKDNVVQSTARFTEEQLSHRVLHDLLVQNVKDPTNVSSQALLAMIEKVSKV